MLAVNHYIITHTQQQTAKSDSATMSVMNSVIKASLQTKSVSVGLISKII